MFAVSYDMKDFFFDRRAVTSRVDIAERQVLSKQGAFVRRRARTQILRRSASKGSRASVKRLRGGKASKVQAVARPGSPPIVRSKSKVETLRNILFGYNPSSHSVFIGPVGLNKKPVSSSASTIPQLMEKGGTAGVFQWKPDRSNVWSLGNVRRPGVSTRIAKGRYANHPFMGPALDAEVAAGTIAGPWSGAVQ